MILFEAFVFCVVCLIGLIVTTVFEALQSTKIEAEEMVFRLFRKHRFNVTDRRLLDSLENIDTEGGRTMEAWEERYASR